jgi:Tol biopolymer transport system component
VWSATLACGPADPGSSPSPSDGLVFVRLVDGSPEVMRLRLSDGAEQAVTQTPERSERWPYCSNAAQRLIFQTSRADAPRDSDLVLWDPRSGTETRFPPTPHRQERWPTWSPHGDAIAYAFRGGRPPGGVAIVDLAERTQRIIARSGRRDFFLRPAFAPDGVRLVAQRRSPGSGRSNLWLLSTSGPPRPLTDESHWNDTKAWFTRDGKRIVFSRRTAEGGAADVMSIAAAGGDLRTIIGTSANEHSARPSPTRDEIVFVSNLNGPSRIFVVDLDGGAPRSLTPKESRNLVAPRWSPDGERIVATVIPGEAVDDEAGAGASVAGMRLVVLDRDGNAILETPGAMADWMPPWP